MTDTTLKLTARATRDQAGKKTIVGLDCSDPTRPDDTVEFFMTDNDTTFSLLRVNGQDVVVRIAWPSESLTGNIERCVLVEQLFGHRAAGKVADAAESGGTTGFFDIELDLVLLAHHADTAAMLRRGTGQILR